MKFKRIFAVCIGIALIGGFHGSQVYGAESTTVLNVTDYGADGTDQAADNAAIQDALDAVPESGGIVKIPAGKYYLDKSLVIHSNTELILDSNAEMIRNDLTGPMLRNYLGSVDTVLQGKGYGQTVNVKISGGVWNGNITGSSYNASADIIRIYCATDVKISDTTITGVCGNHHIDMASVNGAEVSGVTFTGFVYFSGTDYSSLETGDGNKNELNATASITSEALQFDCYDSNYYNKNVTVTGCTFDGVLSGVGNHHDGMSTQNIKITGNTFRNIANTCVNLYDFTGAKVSGNTAVNVRSFARVCAGKDITISNNGITAYTDKSKNKYNMFRISDGAVLTISGNKVDGAGAAGIKLDSASKAVISENEIKNTTHNAVSISDSAADITNNMISSPQNIGIYFNKSTGTVTGNTVTKAVLRAVGIQNGSSVAEVSGNSITGGGEQGIYLSESSSAVNIQKNVITNAGGDAISISGSAVTAIGGGAAEANQITGAGKNGISIKSSTVGTVTGNVIKSPGVRGIYFSASKATQVGQNTIENAAADGINLSDNSSVAKIGGSAADGNTITGSATNGIAVKTASASEISYNVISDSESANIRLESLGAAAVISQNSVSGAAKQGISAAGSTVTVTENTIDNSGTYGIYLDGAKSSATVERNKVTKVTGGNGIRVCAGKAVLTGNTVKNTKTQGIYVVKGTVTLSGNIVSGAGSDGFKAGGGTVYMLSGNAKMQLKNKELIVVGAESKSAAAIKIPAKITIGKTSFPVTSIQASAFKNNKKITEVQAGTNVVTIGASAFEGCTKLRNFTASSKKLKAIGKKAFYNCKALSNVTLSTTKLTDKNVGANAFKKIKNKCAFKVPKKKVTAYKKIFMSKGATKNITVKK